MKRHKPPSQRKVPMSSTDAIQFVTKMMVAGGRQISGDDDAKIRADIKAAFKESTESDDDYRVRVEMKDGQVETCISQTGMFRTVFNVHGLDRKDPWQQERWWGIVEEAMNWALAQNDGDYRRKTA